MYTAARVAFAQISSSTKREWWGGIRIHLENFVHLGTRYDSEIRIFLILEMVVYYIH